MPCPYEDTETFNLNQPKTPMIPLLSRKMHGLTDYSYIPLVAMSPHVMGFADVRPAALLCMVLPLMILGSSLLTRAEWGLLRVLPFKIHLFLDVAVGFLALSSPWLLGFSDQPNARNTLIFFGIFGILAGTLSRPEEMLAPTSA